LISHKDAGHKSKNFAALFRPSEEAQQQVEKYSTCFHKTISCGQPKPKEARF
jgi:hypothetical protein